MSASAIRELCERWDWPWPENAIISAVRSTFPELRLMTPPIDVAALASKRNIQEIREVRMEMDGKILRIPGGGYRVEVNAAHSAARKRFTCAHEIGHTFFFDLGDKSTEKTRALVEDANLRNLTVDNQEEALCNLAAAEILMPHAEFTKTASAIGPSAETILALSKSYYTSLWSTARRLVQLSRLKLIVALWEFRPQRRSYFAKWVASARPGPAPELSVDDGMPIFKSFQSRSPFRGRKWVSLGGPIDHYYVDGLPLRSSGVERVLTVFILEPTAERILTWQMQHSHEPRQMRLF